MLRSVSSASHQLKWCKNGRTNYRKISWKQGDSLCQRKKLLGTETGSHDFPDFKNTTGEIAFDPATNRKKIQKIQDWLLNFIVWSILLVQSSKNLFRNITKYKIKVVLDFYEKLAIKLSESGHFVASSGCKTISNSIRNFWFVKYLRCYIFNMYWWTEKFCLITRNFFIISCPGYHRSFLRNWSSSRAAVL